MAEVESGWKKHKEWVSLRLFYLVTGVFSLIIFYGLYAGLSLSPLVMIIGGAACLLSLLVYAGCQEPNEKLKRGVWLFFFKVLPIVTLILLIIGSITAFPLLPGIGFFVLGVFTFVAHSILYLDNEANGPLTLFALVVALGCVLAGLYLIVPVLATPFVFIASFLIISLAVFKASFLNNPNNNNNNDDDDPEIDALCCPLVTPLLPSTMSDYIRDKWGSISFAKIARSNKKHIASYKKPYSQYI